MTNTPFVLVLSSILLLGMVVPTGASSGDQLWTDPTVVLEPGSGLGGEYASLNADGELEVDLSSPGVNAGAVIVVDGVFVVRNKDDTAVGIWFSHDEPAAVELAVEGKSAHLEDDPIVLAPGEEASVDLSVDSSGRSAGDVMLSSFTINAEPASDDETGTGSSSDGSSTTPTASGDGPADTNTTDEPATPVPPPSGGDEVIFADGRDPGVTITALDAETAGTSPDQRGFDGPPRPAIDPVSDPWTFDTDGPARSVDGADAFVDAGESLSLSADRTVFGTAEAIQPDGHVVRLVDIEVPAHRTVEAALVRLEVDRDGLGGADPTDARIGRQTEDGWQLLATSVVEADDERAILQARTSGFSRFAVFADPAVAYDWQLADGERADTATVEMALDRPGTHAVTLTVTDGLGRAATAKYRVLANDRPDIAIDVPPTIQSDEPVELRADVTDAVGETTVTWRFADGTTAVGPSVERSFPAGEHEVSVTVTDEYGATATTSRVLAVGGVAQATRAVVELARLGVAIEDRLVLTGVVVALLVAGLRRWAAGPRRSRTRRVR